MVCILHALEFGLHRFLVHEPKDFRCAHFFLQEVLDLLVETLPHTSLAEHRLQFIYLGINIDAEDGQQVDDAVPLVLPPWC